MNNAATSSAELSNDQQDILRSLLDSEIVLIGGGEAVGVFN